MVLDAVDLTALFAQDGEFTVFAPTDEAFAALPESALDALVAGPNALGKILRYQVVAGELDSAAVIGSSSLTTLVGAEVTVSVTGDVVMINEAAIREVDIAASNGVTRIIDAVLLPAEEGANANTVIDVAMADGNFTTLLAAIDAAGLTATLADANEGSPPYLQHRWRFGRAVGRHGGGTSRRPGRAHRAPSLSRNR